MVFACVVVCYEKLIKLIYADQLVSDYFKSSENN